MPNNDNLISYKQAKELRLRFYYTGKLCRRGHRAPRYTSTKGCKDCVKQWQPRDKICWRNMLARCHNEDHPDYALFGGKGIKVADRWQGETGFYNFIDDMGPRPINGWLARHDNNKDYTPENCFWRVVLQRNVGVVINGERVPLVFAATAIGISPSTITKAAHKKYGGDVQAAYENLAIKYQKKLNTRIN